MSIKWDPSLTKSQVSLKNMMKTCGDDDQGFLVECRVIELKEMPMVEPNKDESICTAKELVKTVLDNFSDMFEWPERLPPSRSIEHHIHFKAPIL